MSTAYNHTAYNVTRLNNKSVYNDIQTFIGKFESDRTAYSYETSLTRFFYWFAGKTLNQLTESDLQIRNADMLNYRKFLQDHPADLSNNTINNYISPIQSLFEFLETNEYNVKSIHLKIDPLSDDSTGYGMIHLHEAKKVEQILLQENTKRSYAKYLSVKMAVATGFRKDSLLKLTYSDIKPVYNEPDFYSVSTTGKGGKKHTVYITKDLYEELLKLKEISKRSDDLIFGLSTKTIQEIVNNVFPQAGITKERRVVWHSFRQTLGEFMSLEELKGFLNHSNINTTMRYRNKMVDPKSSPNLRAERQIDNSVLDRISKEDLIKIILNQSEGVLYGIKSEAEDMLKD